MTAPVPIAHASQSLSPPSSGTVNVPSISLRRLTVAYREGSRTYPALNELDLDIGPGEFVVVTGRNGSGKTTLCRMLAGFVPEHIDADVSGSVEFDGRSMLNVQTRERVGLVGYVFDAPYDQLTGAARTVEEEVAFGLENLGVPRREMAARIDEALRVVRIDHLAHRHPWSLSGGQTQRLALASVLALRPSILVLDEPTSQLDPLGTREVVDAVSHLSRSGLSVVYVTHDVEAVLEVADRFIVLAEGKAVAAGPTGEVATRIATSDLGVVPPPAAVVGVALAARLRLDPPPLTVESCVAAIIASPMSGRAAEPARQDLHETSDAGPDGAPDPRLGGPSDQTRSPIHLRAVSFTYPHGPTALREVTLDLDGGCICFIGQNGSGKSTLMRHLNGLLKPDSGSVTVAGLDTADHPVHELAKLVGVAFQNPDDQLFNRTVRDEVAFGARTLGRPEAEALERADEALDLLDLSATAGRRPLELSLAARKRVIAASVIAMGSHVVVLDEPTSAQDGPGTAAIERAVSHLVRSGRTAIVVSHDMEFVARSADRVVAMFDGSIALDGTPALVFGQVEDLARTSVEPPAAARIGLGIGLPSVPLNAQDLINAIDR